MPEHSCHVERNRQPGSDRGISDYLSTRVMLSTAEPFLIIRSAYLVALWGMNP
jgi:hypothetical protein